MLIYKLFAILNFLSNMEKPKPTLTTRVSSSIAQASSYLPSVETCVGVALVAIPLALFLKHGPNGPLMTPNEYWLNFS